MGGVRASSKCDTQLKFDLAKYAQIFFFKSFILNLLRRIAGTTYGDLFEYTFGNLHLRQTSTVGVE